VPSLTELLFALGLADRVVARTGFCVHPREGVRGVPKVGGTKDVDLAALAATRPTHLVVNVDENRRELVDAARAFVPRVIVTHPLGPGDNPRLFRLFGAIFGVESAAGRLVADFDAALAALDAAVATLPREPVLYLIWRKPWMTVARDTYIARLLACVGWQTLPAQQGGEHGAARYPTLQGDEPWLTHVREVLLSSEPYAFTQAHVAQAQALCPQAQVRLVDGELLSWYGPRTAAGLRYLRELSQ
jgi:ABC-type Fe3+-hydroxamate transport system substrate-binding protein